jgi:hypothetical protein
LQEALELKSQLEAINIDQSHKYALPGSVVITDQGSFFISVSAGKVVVDGAEYFCVSVASPIGAALLKSTKADIVTFNNRTYKVVEVF